MSIAPKTQDMLHKSTIKIKHPTFCKKKRIWKDNNGTGFICTNPENQKQYIVTAKHVIEGDNQDYITSPASNSSIIFSTNGNIVEIQNPDWKLHDDHDIAALPMDQVILQANEDSIQIDYECVPPDKIVDYDFVRGKDSIPINVMSPYAWDNGNPEGRSGKTIKLLNEGSDSLSHFLISSECIGMDSGSPVYINDAENLIGILSARFIFDYSIPVNQLTEIPNIHEMFLKDHPDLKMQIPYRIWICICVGSNVLIEWFGDNCFS